MNRDSTLGLDPQKLARLVGITLDSEGDVERDNPGQSTSELIHTCLAETLLFDTAMIDDLPVVIGHTEKDHTFHAGKRLGELLIDPKSDLEMIREVRRYAKKAASLKKSQIRHAVAITVYFAAIANALIFHHLKITTVSYESLKDSFDNLADKPWMPPDLVELFRKAREVRDRERP